MPCWLVRTARVAAVLVLAVTLSACCGIYPQWPLKVSPPDVAKDPPGKAKRHELHLGTFSVHQPPTGPEVAWVWAFEAGNTVTEHWYLLADSYAYPGSMWDPADERLNYRGEVTNSSLAEFQAWVSNRSSVTTSSVLRYYKHTIKKQEDHSLPATVAADPSFPVDADTNVTLTASGANVLKYRWQKSNGPSDPFTFTGAPGPTLTILVKAASAGHRYRCVVYRAPAADSGDDYSSMTITNEVVVTLK